MKELYSNGFASSIAQAIEEMKAEQGNVIKLRKSSKLWAIIKFRY